MKSSSTSYSGILLAGGKSSRMGEEKAFMKYKNRFLFEYSLSVLHSFSGEIFVSSSNAAFFKLHLNLIPDTIPGIGPLGGIYSCLQNISNKSSIVLPCDLPLISEEVIEKLISHSKGYDITIPLNHQNAPEPLIGIYSSSVIPEIEKMIAAGQYKMQNLLSSVKTCFVKFPEIPATCFQNINTYDDFKSLPDL